MTLSISQRRVLVALVEMHDESGRATVRELAQATDRTVMPTQQHLVNLRRLGLVAPAVVGALRPVRDVVVIQGSPFRAIPVGGLAANLNP